jgi:hypothetical protein
MPACLWIEPPHCQVRGSGSIVCDMHELDAYREWNRGFVSANAALATRLLASENSVVKQDPTLLWQVFLPSCSGKVDRESHWLTERDQEPDEGGELPSTPSGTPPTKSP